MRISSFLIAIMLVGMTFIIIYGIIDDLDDTYGININQSYKDDMERTTNISTQIKTDYHSIEGNWTVNKESYLGLIPDALSLIKSTVVIPFAVTEDLIFTSTRHLKIQPEVSTIINAIILMMVIAAFIALILRYKYT